MSGGTDSSLAAYLLAKKFSRDSKKRQIIPIIITEPKAPFQLQFASQVIAFIESQFAFRFQTPETFLLQQEDKIDFMRTIENQLFTNDTVDLVISAVTHEPKDPTFDYKHGPDDDRTQENQKNLWDDRILTPFINIDKKEIADYYVKNDLIESLFNLTRSCVSTTKDFSFHCGKCWWCKERLWAFGRL